MSETPPTPTPEAMVALVREAQKRLDRPHTNIKVVTDLLVQGGVEPQKATELVNNILQNIRRQQAERERTARRDMLIGGLILVVGIVITAVSYYNAGSTGSYVVTWGAMMVGGFRFFKGMTNA